MIESPIQDKIHNISLVVEEIKESPQTYKTILAEEERNGTLQFILRRKLNNLVSDGSVCKTAIPGTRFGKAIFYVVPKKYHILVESGRVGSTVYYFYKYEKAGKYYINIEECWELIKGKWEKLPEMKTIFEGNVLKWI